MARSLVKDRYCTNENCSLSGQCGKGNIVRHSFVQLKHGTRRRYRCTACGKTFSSTKGTPHYRLHCCHRAFDEVATMSVEGVSKSAIARIKGLAWNTVARWLERAAAAARHFNHCKTHGYELKELQADKIRTFIERKDRPTWIFTTIEVWSRIVW